MMRTSSTIWRYDQTSSWGSITSTGRDCSQGKATRSSSGNAWSCCAPRIFVWLSSEALAAGGFWAELLGSCSGFFCGCYCSRSRRQRIHARRKGTWTSRFGKRSCTIFMLSRMHRRLVWETHIYLECTSPQLLQVVCIVSWECTYSRRRVILQEPCTTFSSFADGKYSRSHKHYRTLKPSTLCPCYTRTTALSVRRRLHSRQR